MQLLFFKSGSGTKLGACDQEPVESLYNGLTITWDSRVRPESNSETLVLVKLVF